HVDGLCDVVADLLAIDVEGRDELEVAHVVVAELDVHQSRDLLGGIRVAIVFHALDQGTRAVAQAGDGDPNRILSHSLVLSSTSSGCPRGASTRGRSRCGADVRPGASPS